MAEPASIVFHAQVATTEVRKDRQYSAPIEVAGLRFSESPAKPHKQGIPPSFRFLHLLRRKLRFVVLQRLAKQAQVQAAAGASLSVYSCTVTQNAQSSCPGIGKRIGIPF